MIELNKPQLEEATEEEILESEKTVFPLGALLIIGILLVLIIACVIVICVLHS